MMKKIQIKDLYAGKPDAKDELSFNSSENFIKTFVIAEHFNIESLISGNNCFITGFKGTGKTALLYYLDNKLKEMDEATCSSFILFKEDFAGVKRDELQSISNRLLSSISIAEDALIRNNEFEYIWRWLFFKRIVADNNEFSRNLFVDDENWQKFENTVNQIKDPVNNKKSLILNKIRLAFPFKDNASLTETGAEIEVDLSNRTDDNYKKFLMLIDQAECLFASVNKTDIPYYIFVDELEAYYGEESIFKRDLGLIRDLVFTVKRINEIISKSQYSKMKVICSVRTEIIHAISRFVVTKEINKILTGFSVPLNWSYSNSNSYTHPIIEILLKRIAVCSNNEEKSFLEIYKEWFPENINGIDPVSYILNNSWYKPRDMVRLITTAQNSIHNKSTYFSQAVFTNAAKDYSEDSLSEIKEELQALYKSDQIDLIISCFSGFKSIFSFTELTDRIKKYFPNTILETQTNQILKDLYRLGFLGNYLPMGKVYHWQHKGDGMLIISDEWRFFVHYALHKALALGAKNNRALNVGKKPETGDVITAKVYKTNNSFAYVSFEAYGNEYKGSIHLTEFKKLGYGYIDSLSNIVNINDEFTVAIKDFNEKLNLWNLLIVAD